jgi:hypothetical protein
MVSNHSLKRTRSPAALARRALAAGNASVVAVTKDQTATLYTAVSDDRRPRSVVGQDGGAGGDSDANRIPYFPQAHAARFQRAAVTLARDTQRIKPE